MKKFLQRVVLVAVAMATAQVAVAESWRINNDTSKGAHFVDINAAMASELVKDGDVLYLDPGCVLTTAQTISKAVTVIGTGWDFSDKPYAYAQISGGVQVNAPAKLLSLYVTNTVYVNVDNIVIERCRVDGDIFNNKKGKISYLQVLSSYFYRVRGGYYTSDELYYATISNCIISNGYSDSYGLLNLNNATILNNAIVLKGSSGNCVSGTENSVLKNNIIMNIYGSRFNLIESGCSGNTFINNCLSADSSTAYASANVCMNTKDASTAFLNNGAVGGAAYQLCEGSPAIGAGEGGIDCGPYAKGSLYPFVTYGMPKHIPYFTEAAVPAQPTDGKVKVSLKIVNQND
ncbi:MAG: right-handed parallel beta-helix repeat-containing protein [Bacteroidaceae bacterium]|nr:right-handed parallel beta-helix repeat-containing protein [Bacteroidaceae bacterium]